MEWEGTEMTNGNPEALGAGHRLVLEGRSRLAVEGVTDVMSFDETAAVLETGLGTLILRGQGLHMEQLDLGAGSVAVTGTVDSMVYEENRQSQGSFLARLFR
jgi:sporulation protein YabP